MTTPTTPCTPEQATNAAKMREAFEAWRPIDGYQMAGLDDIAFLGFQQGYRSALTQAVELCGLERATQGTMARQFAVDDCIARIERLRDGK